MSRLGAALVAICAVVTLAAGSLAATTCPSAPSGCAPGGATPCTYSWTDPALSTATHIRLIHFEELRACIGFADSFTTLKAPKWSDEPLTANTPVRIAHVTEMRAALAALCAYYGDSSPQWTHPTLAAGSSSLTAADIQDLRNALAACQPKGPGLPPETCSCTCGVTISNPGSLCSPIATGCSSGSSLVSNSCSGVYTGESNTPCFLASGNSLGTGSGGAGGPGTCSCSCD